MLKIITTLSALVIGALAQAQISETREMKAFTQLEISDGIEVNLVQGTASVLTATTQDGASLSDLITVFKDGKLRIYSKSGEKIQGKVSLTTSGLQSIKISDGARMSGSNEILANTLRIYLSNAIFSANVSAVSLTVNATGSAIYNGKVNSTDFQASFRDNSRLNIAGKTRNATITGNTKAICNARDFVASKASVTAVGTSSVITQATEELDITIDQGAQVSYFGQAKKIKLPDDAQLSHKGNYIALTR